MTQLLTRLFVRDRNDPKSPAARHQYGRMVSVVGILMNLFLFAVKLIAGILSGSLSIRADAINNLSDAGSSVVALLSFKLAAKPADRDHPFGHARLEYVASMIVAFLILLVGADLIKGAVTQLFSPVAPVFHWITVLILSLSVGVKLWLFLFGRRIGRRINSEVLCASAADALADAAATAAVLLATLLAPWLPAQIAAYIDPVMGLLVAGLILWAGLRVLNETKNSILGEAPDAETVQLIRDVVAEYPDALGIHDLAVHSYGPTNRIATLHVEVDGKRDVFATHDTIDNIERRLLCDHNIQCTIHLDPIVTDDERVTLWRERVSAFALELHPTLRIHDFRMVPGTTHTNLIFDIEAPFELRQSDAELKAAMAERIAAEAPSYFAVISVDRV